MRKDIIKQKNHAGWQPLNAFNQKKKEDLEIYSRETFIQIFEYERKRSARNNTSFSLLIFSFNDCSYKMNYITSIIDLIKKKIRHIDHLGWCSADKLAIILPGTDHDGAILLMNKIKFSESFISESCEMTIESSSNHEEVYYVL